MEIKNSHILLETCCILNLCASGQFLNILKAISAQAVITYEVEKELKAIEDLFQFESAIAQKLLGIIDFESESEQEVFVNYTTQLGDGEAATGAIAIQRGWAIATDDKKAISFFSQEKPSLPIFSTLAIVKSWSEITKINPSELKIALNNIRLKGRYCPPKSHPLKNWWDTAITLE